MATAEAPAMQFDDLTQQRRTDLIGMWVFLATELMLFGGVFTAFAVLRMHHPQAFAAGARELDLALGTINTALLLTSGLSMAVAERAAASRRCLATQAWLTATLALGTVFLGIKGYEWHHEYAHGLMPLLGLPFQGDAGEQRFFELYYTLTGMHAFHMLVGLGLLGVAVVAVRRRHPGRAERRVRITGLYWAFVDVVWLFVFTTLYLLRS